MAITVGVVIFFFFLYFVVIQFLLSSCRSCFALIQPFFMNKNICFCPSSSKFFLFFSSKYANNSNWFNRNIILCLTMTLEVILLLCSIVNGTARAVLTKANFRWNEQKNENLKAKLKSATLSSVKFGFILCSWAKYKAEKIKKRRKIWFSICNQLSWHNCFI